jgi:hypothetical protein
MDPPRVRLTVKHSYFANIRGLRLGTINQQAVCNTNRKDYPTIAITTRQFSYLRCKGVTEATPIIPEEEIEDRSKTDYFTKDFAVVQISWLILSLVGRAARHLTISQLEILTVTFAICAIATYGFTWNKPQDVNTAIMIHVSRPLNNRETVRIVDLHPKALFDIFAGIMDVPDILGSITHIPNGNIELSEGYLQPISLWLTTSVMLFGAIHLSAWNFSFPSSAERTLWRIGSIAITMLPVLTLINSLISSVSYGMREEVRSFENSIVSLWEDYYVSAGPEASELPPPNPFDRDSMTFLGMRCISQDSMY